MIYRCRIGLVAGLVGAAALSLPSAQAQIGTREAVCSTMAQGEYACTVQFWQPDQGYDSVMELIPARAHLPRFMLQVINETARAEVSISRDNGSTWKTLGAFYGGRERPIAERTCWLPSGDPRPEVAANRGVSIWLICAR